MDQEERIVGVSNQLTDEEAFRVGMSETFARMSKLVVRDLDKPRYSKAFWGMFNKDQVEKFLEHPDVCEKELRRAINYIYGASPHFRRVIQYFVGLSDLSYIVEPFNIDPKVANVRTTNLNYRKVLSTLSAMSIKSQFPRILTVCLREDVFYGTFRGGGDSIMIQQLPSDFCKITSIEDKVPNVTFDFSYFDMYPEMLEYYSDEFKIKYEYYKTHIVDDLGNVIDKRTRAYRAYRWIELDSPTSFAIKCNSDILDYALPPFAGILREIYDIEDYKQLKNTKTALENYCMLAMRLPLADDGSWGIDLEKAKDFWMNLDSVLPEEVGSVLTPMPIDKIDFDKSNTGDTDTVAEAEQNLFTAAGVSSLLFNNPKASANALLLSIKADQAITFGIVKNIEDAINRYIRSFKYGKNFKVTFLDCSPFNRKEVGDAYLKAATYGLPTISAYAASQGIGQEELDSMSFLEGTVLGLQQMFVPLQSSTQMSSADLESEAATDEGGAPKKEIGEVSDSREANQENE